MTIFLVEMFCPLVKWIKYTLLLRLLFKVVQVVAAFVLYCKTYGAPLTADHKIAAEEARIFVAVRFKGTEHTTGAAVVTVSVEEYDPLVLEQVARALTS